MLTSEVVFRSGGQVDPHVFTRLTELVLKPPDYLFPLYARRLDDDVIAVVCTTETVDVLAGPQPLYPDDSVILYFKETPRGYQRIRCPRQLAESVLAFDALRHR